MSEVGFHRRLADKKYRGNVGVRSSGGDEFKHLNLPGAQACLRCSHSVEQSRRYDGFESAFSGSSGTDGGGEFVGRGIIEEVATGACFDGTENVGIGVVIGEDENVGGCVEGISAILSMPGDRIVFSDPSAGSSGASFADSTITAQQATAWASTNGVTAAAPIGISQTRAEAGDARVAIAVFGVEPGFDATAPSQNGLLGLSIPAAEELGVSAGDDVTIAGITYVVETIGGDAWYSHTPVVQMTLDDWQTYSAATGSPDTYATVLAITGDPDWAPNSAASTPDEIDPPRLSGPTRSSKQSVSPTSATSDPTNSPAGNDKG